MGFFDKIKNFVGIGGVKIELIKYENPFPITDSVYKANFEISSDRDLTLLSKSESIIAKRLSPDGMEEQIVIQQESTLDKGVNQDVYPYSIKKGETLKDGSCIIRVDILKALEQYNVTDAESAERNGFTFFFKVIIDVKETGLLFDPYIEIEFHLIS